MRGGRCVDRSAGLASAEASFVVTLDGHALALHVANASDAMSRSGLSDALRMEISLTGAVPAVTNRHEYTYVPSTAYVPADDARLNDGVVRR